MARCSDYCVIYDISDDSERRKVDIILKGYGFRIQKSVFECRMRKRDYNNLVSVNREIMYRNRVCKNIHYLL